VATNADPRLIQLAESISDRAPVSWDDARSSSGEHAAVVDGLARVQAIADAFAASQAVDDRDGRNTPVARWGQLEILEPIGEGAFGEVFRARDPNLDREVALKLRHAGPGAHDSAGRRLLEEARKLARVRHPNVVAVHGADLCDGRVGIWTELVDGRTLEQRLEADGPMGPGETVAVGLDLCRALAAIHAAGLVHGDVKAANVIRERGGRIVLTDLGSATEEGTTPLTGSPATLAPEVLAGGPATAAADLYSLGLLLVRLLTGTGQDIAAASNLRDLRPDLPADLVRVVERAADRDPDRRHPSAGALERALTRVAGLASTVEAGQSVQTRVGSRRLTLLAVAATAVVAAAAALWWAGSTSTTTTPVERVSPPVTSTLAVTTADEPRAEPESAEPLPAAAQPAPALRPLEVDAAMLRADADGVEPLADGARVRPGDRLALEIETAEPVHVWVINEDLEGRIFLLFPIDGLELSNPLPAGRRLELPGRLGGVPQRWQVTSASGRERFLVIASRRHLPELEREIATMAAAGAEPATGVTRGVGGLAPAALAGVGRLEALAARLAETRRGDGSVWLQQLELVNP
jgi:hypothetical protein